MLHSFLKPSFQDVLSIPYFHIILTPESKVAFPEITQFFEKSLEKDVFINDIVFIEENKNKFNENILPRELNKESALIFPIIDNGTNVKWLVEIGNKKFWDYYSLEEIQLLRKFIDFLQWHLRYISIYWKIQELTVTLDKKVDEKTIAYNNLINKQKDFISYIGHEIKNPITNAIFLSDWLNETLSDLADGKETRQAKEDGDILYSELLKVADLVKHVFSTEKFDLNKIQLYKKQIRLSEFLHEELWVFESHHSNIFFERNITDVWTVHIDEVQFRQVIINLFINAIKFSDTKQGKVCVSCYKDTGRKQIIIEDNWISFSDTDISGMFEKYSTGSGNAVWLWMWLYLCKKILELHGGDIRAEKSSKLWGAKFILTL